MVSVAFSHFIADVHQEIDTIAEELETVNGSDRITPAFKFDDSAHPRLLRFEPFYQKLRVIISRNPSLTDRRGQPLDTTPPTQTTSPLAPTFPTTPPPSSNVVDPKFSSTSNATASSAAESTDEHFTQSFANDFVDASYRSLLKSLSSIAWYRDTKYELQHGCPAATDYYIRLISETIRRCV